MKKNKKNLLFLLLLFFILGVSFVPIPEQSSVRDYPEPNSVLVRGVLAQEKALEVGQYPLVPGAEAPTSTRAFLPDYAKYVLNLLFSLVGLVIFGALVYGGFHYLTASGSPIKLETAKKQVLAAFLGLIIILCSYLILYTINPQLVIFRVPEWIKVELPPFVKPLPPLDEQTLYAKEIPTGKLIDGIGKEIEGGSVTSPLYEYEGVFAKTRLERIIVLVKEIEETTKKVYEISTEISEAAQTLENLVQSCVCGNCQEICGGCGNCDGECTGDPCGPVRGGIIQQQGILSAKAAEILPYKEVLEKLKEKLEIEKEKLENALAELKRAERLMKECPSSFSEQGKTQALLSFDNLWQYKEGLERLEIVKKVEIRPIWENINTGDDAFTFYCTEMPFEVSLEEGGISEEQLEEAISKIETTEPTRVFCEMEIPVGSIIDNSEDISQRIIKEMEKIIIEIEKMIEEIPKESANASRLSPLPDCYACGAWCGCVCEEVWECVPVPCPEPEPTPEPEPEPEPISDGDGGEWWEWWYHDLFPTALAQGGCCEPQCVGCEVSQPCEGNPCPGEKAEIARLNSLIQESHRKITAAYNNIITSIKEIRLLIEGERKPTWAYRIINTELSDVRIKLGDPIRGCLNDTEDWTRAIFGEKILGKQILSCEDAKSVCWNIEEDYECYGEGDLEAYTNYFCAEVTSP